MKNSMEVKPNIFWVGSLDFDLKVFDIVMRTDFGTTYNSYIVKGKDKTVLFEVTKDGFFDEFLERVNSVCNVTDIDYVVISHTEPDHTGALSRLLEVNPDIKVIASDVGIKFLKNIVNKDFNAMPVKDGDTLDIGSMTLKFMLVPFLHWPDTMFTYIPEEQAIFTCDCFGCHYASDKVFNDAIGKDENFVQAYKYYFDNILAPFKSHVLSMLNKISDLDIVTILTGHGPVIRVDSQDYIDMYKNWATVKKPERPLVVVAYLSAYGYTRKIADKIIDGLKSSGKIDVNAYDLLDTEPEAIISELSTASGLLLGSPTLVGDTLPPMWDILKALNPNVHKGLLTGAFGSYGWSGEAVLNIEGRFKQLRLKTPVPGLRICFKPDESKLNEAYDFGVSFGKAVLGEE
ncbi:MAG: FprA family A-type flavoprotein [Clostridiales bacterium]|nr:FprA family A-type flavoprotein [Clostridiales bacterium]